MAERVVLGERYRLEPTGYEGVATARTEYLGERVNVRLERLRADGSVEETWWPETRLSPVFEGDRRSGFGPRVEE